MNRQEELTKLQTEIINLFANHHLTTKEIGAMRTVIMQNMLIQPMNVKVLEEINVDAESLTFEQVTLFQRILAEEYYKEIINHGQSDN